MINFFENLIIKIKLDSKIVILPKNWSESVSNWNFYNDIYYKIPIRKYLTFDGFSIHHNKLYIYKQLTNDFKIQQIKVNELKHLKNI